MKKVLSGLTAATAGMGVMVAVPSAAHAFVPIVLAAIIGGSVLGGAVVGGTIANANANANPAVVAPAPVVASPGVTVGSTTCYFTRAWVNNGYRRVQVCNNY